MYNEIEIKADMTKERRGLRNDVAVKFFVSQIGCQQVLYQQRALCYYFRGISPEDAIAVEDSKAGVKAAKAAGIFCFGYQNPTSGSQNLQQADCQIRHLREITAN